MRDYTKVSNSVWRSRKFRSLKNGDCQLAYLYILTGPHSNSAGCYDLPIQYACADLEWDDARYRTALDRLCDTQLVQFDRAENTVLITQWFDHNEPMNAKHALSILIALEQASSDRLKAIALDGVRPSILARKCVNDKDVGKKIQGIIDRIGEGISTLTLTETPTETGTLTKPDLDLNAAEQILPGALAAAPDGAALAPVVEEFPELPEALDRNHPLLQTELMRKSA